MLEVRGSSVCKHSMFTLHIQMSEFVLSRRQFKVEVINTEQLS